MFEIIGAILWCVAFLHIMRTGDTTNSERVDMQIFAFLRPTILERLNREQKTTGYWRHWWCNLTFGKLEDIYPLYESAGYFLDDDEKETD